MESVHSSYGRTRVTTGGKRACTCALSGIENAVARNAKHRRQASGRGEKWWASTQICSAKGRMQAPVGLQAAPLWHLMDA